jgi:phenylacetate-CoA ligase
LHVSPDVGIVEIVNERGRPLPVGEMGEVVTTGFLNFDQPLIRYRMGDIASISVADCPCKRQMPVIEELVGRLEDVVIGSDGRETVRFHGIFVGLPHVKEGQIIQHDLTNFEIRLVVDEGFGEAERQVIRKRFEERLGLVDLRFSCVEHIERTQGGKFKAVISHVARVPAR